MPPNHQFVKAYKAMVTYGYKVNVVKRILHKLLKLYEKKWELIEDNNYQVLLDAILDSEEQKARDNELEDLITLSKDEAEEDEPHPKISKLARDGRQSLTSFHASMPDGSDEVRNQPHGKQKLPESIYENLQDKDMECRPICVPEYSHGKGMSSSTTLSLVVVEQAKKANFVSDDESEKCNPLETLTHLEKSGNKSDVHHGLETYKRGNRTPFSIKTSKLHLIDEDIGLEEMEFGSHLHEPALEYESYDLPYVGFSPGSTPVLPRDVHSIGSESDLEVNKPEPVDYEQSEAEKNENNAQGSLKLDVASSSGGEVKIFLLDQSSPKPDAHVPSLEAVLKQVEEKCLKSHKLPQTGLSMFTLMKEMRECFLAAGTALTYTEDARPINVVSSIDISKDTNLETDPDEGHSELSLCSTISYNPFGIQNLLKVWPQIHRFVGSIKLDLSRCRIYLNVDPKHIDGMEKVEIKDCMLPSSRMMIIQKCYYQFITDVTEGQEAYEISLINEVNEEQIPPFNYIPRNMTYSNAYTRFLLAHISENCCSFGDCLSLKIPCACVGKTVYEFAYTTGSLLKEKFLDNVISKNYSVIRRNLYYCQDCPIERCKGTVLSCKCKGHIMRNFVRECWYKCGCGINCGNRVVQRGITAKMQVFRTPSQKGWGLRTLEDIPKGAFICEYVGEVITSRESFKRNLQNSAEKLAYPVLLDADWSSKGVLKDEEALCLDATVYGNVSRFINHRCFDANLVEIPVEVETPDHSYYHLAFFTTRKVDAFEELTWDYGTDFYHPVKQFQCLCGSNFCRDRKPLKRKKPESCDKVDKHFEMDCYLG